jgi:hypothetical protein
LLTQIKNHSYYPILDNGINLFHHLYNDNGSGHQLHHYLSESSPSYTDPNQIQNQGARLDTIIEMETKVTLKPPFIKRVLLVDDDPDITLTFKAGLEGHFFNDMRRFEVYTYNDPC